MQLKIKRISPAAVIPQYATPGSAAFDLRAIDVPDAGVIVSRENPGVFSTGLTFEIPPGWVMLINSRSGHGFNNDVRLSNCQGVIDADYRGEVKVKLSADKLPYTIKNGDRIAQALLTPCPQFELQEVDELSTTARGTGGFGSTGKN